MVYPSRKGTNATLGWFRHRYFPSLADLRKNDTCVCLPLPSRAYYVEFQTSLKRRFCGRGCYSARLQGYWSTEAYGLVTHYSIETHQYDDALHGTVRLLKQLWV